MDVEITPVVRRLLPERGEENTTCEGTDLICDAFNASFSHCRSPKWPVVFLVNISEDKLEVVLKGSALEIAVFTSCQVVWRKCRVDSKAVGKGRRESQHSP